MVIGWGGGGVQAITLFGDMPNLTKIWQFENIEHRITSMRLEISNTRGWEFRNLEFLSNLTQSLWGH